MTIYVDHLFSTCPTKRWPYNAACHLFTDYGNEEELHRFASKLGLKRIWFQRNVSLDHYDLTAGKRAEAIRLGAIEASREKVVEVIKVKRNARKKNQ